MNNKIIKQIEALQAEQKDKNILEKVKRIYGELSYEEKQYLMRLFVIDNLKSILAFEEEVGDE